jgi:uncharacterized membrane protein (TIGR02234 family)
VSSLPQTSAESATEPVVRTADPAAAGRRRIATRTLALALPLGALGSCLVLFGVRATWTRGTASSWQNPLPVHATGSQMTALPGALALVGLAALVAVFALRRAGRYAVAGLLALSGAGALTGVITGRADHGALDSAAANATGLTHATAGHVSTTAWPLVAAAGGVLLLLAGLIALRYGQSWPAMSGRYERGSDRSTPRARTTDPAPVDLDRSEDVWKALDRGEDPT